MIDDSKAIKTHLVGDGFAETLERIRQAKETPETNKCPTCHKEKLPGAKCGCELVAVEKIVPQPAKLICDKCGGARINFFSRIQHPADCGVFTYLKGYKYPFPGWADQPLVDLDAVSKRGLIAFIKLFPLSLIFQRKKFIKYWAEIADVAWKPIGHKQSKYPPRERFCRSGRELLRVGEFLIDKYNPKNAYDLRAFLWSIVMTWEFDNAYRFRGQDLLAELNQDNLKENYRREILRLIKTGLERERITSKDKQFTLEKKWKLLLIFAKIALYLQPKTSKLIKEFLLALNLEEVKPTEADFYFMSERYDYNFGGIKYEDRLRDKLEQDKEFFGEIKQEENKPEPPYLEIKNQVVFNDAFFEQDLDKAKEMLEAKVVHLTSQLRENFVADIIKKKNEKANKG